MSAALTAMVLSAAVAGCLGAAEASRRADQRDAIIRRAVRASPTSPTATAPAWFGRGLALLEIEVPADRLWSAARFGLVAVAVGAAGWIPFVTGLLVAGGLVGAAAAPAMERRRTRRAFEADLPGALELVVADVAAGATVAGALARGAEREGEVASALAMVVARCGRGWSLQRSLDRWADDAARPSVRLVADAVALAGSSGGSQVRALRNVVITVRERQALDREIAALAAQARASAAVLAATPVAFAAFVATVDPAIGHFLVATPIGWACLGSGAALDTIGAWWMHRIMAVLR